MNKQWIAHYDPKMKETVDCPDKTMYEMLLRTKEAFPERLALVFEGTEIHFTELDMQVDELACALSGLGMKKGDVMTVCLPNIPQAAVMYYAVNKLGIIANMVHPKTPPAELLDFMKSTGSTYLIILDAFMKKSIAVFEELSLNKVIVASIGNYLSLTKRLGFYLTKGRKISPSPKADRYISWKKLMASGRDLRKKEAVGKVYVRPIEPEDPAIYLHSGGTTGSPKTIVLSSLNMNVLAVVGPQIINIDDPFETGIPPDYSTVAILPLFHGFGLCIGLHTMMCFGITSILVPLFTPDSLAKVIIRRKPTIIAAVPTLFEGILKSDRLQKADLSFLTSCFCGGDSLSPDLKTRFEKFVRDRGAELSLREGYGLTETVTVSCVNPEYKSREGSVGLPISNMLMKIVETGTHRELPPGEKGEICISGPTVMLGYLNDPDGTAEAIHTHEDGRRWVHTGDYGYMDADGYFYFTQRMKRIIKVAGIPVFPSQIEAVICDVEGVDNACAIASPDDYRIHVVKAIVVPDASGASEGNEKLRERIMEACIDKLISYSRPVEIEFRQSLPMTLVGKINYVQLEREENEKKDAALK